MTPNPRQRGLSHGSWSTSVLRGEARSRDHITLLPRAWAWYQKERTNSYNLSSDLHTWATHIHIHTQLYTTHIYNLHIHTYYTHIHTTNKYINELINKDTAPRKSPVSPSPPHTRVYRHARIATPGFLCGYWGFELRSLFLNSNHLTHLSSPDLLSRVFHCSGVHWLG